MKCMNCGDEFSKTNQNMKPYCPTSKECAFVYAQWMAWNHVEKVGDCEVWLGCNRGREAGRLRVTVNGKAIYYRVLYLRERYPELAERRTYRNECGTLGCVNLAHNVLMRAAKVSKGGLIKALLPAQPLLDYYEEHPPGKASSAQYEIVRRARESGHVTVSTADNFCIDVLKIHPAVIYGDLFWEAA